MIYCKIVGIEHTTNVDGYPVDKKRSLFREFVRRFTISHLCKNFFCGGDIVKDYLISYGANKERICVHNFTSITKERIINRPLNKEEKLELRKKLGIETKGKVVLGVGRFVPVKRHEDLISAVKRCKTKCDLYILGGKPTKEYLNLVGDNSNIHFLDFVLPEQVDDYFKMADLFVLPSDSEPWGLVVNEAMANGLPVIVSDRVVAGDSLVKDNGYIFGTYDVEKLSEYIDICLDNKVNKKMSRESLKIIKDFTIEGMVIRQATIINRFFNI